MGLLLAAKAGNIGTNHLFEAMVLDRLMAFALGWLALAEVIVHPGRGRWRARGRHRGGDVDSSVGRVAARDGAGGELDGLVSARPMDGSRRPAAAVRGLLGLALAVLPGLAVNLAPGSSLQGNMPADVFWLLSVELQSPQHMLPHLWRMPQWLAWGCYLVLAALRDRWPARPAGSRPAPEAQRRRTTSRALAAGPAPPDRGAGDHPGRTRSGMVCHRGRHQVRVTVFQPFRMATVARGIACDFRRRAACGPLATGGLAGAAAGHPDRGGVHRRLAARGGDPGRAGRLGDRGDSDSPVS